MLMNAMFSILFNRVKALNVSLCDKSKQRMSAVKSLETVNQEHTCVSQDKGVMLGG